MTADVTAAALDRLETTATNFLRGDVPGLSRPWGDAADARLVLELIREVREARHDRASTIEAILEARRHLHRAGWLASLTGGEEKK
jgi:hypothetical protein